MNQKHTRRIVLAALFVALNIVATRILYFYAPTIPPNLVRISPQMVIEALCAWIMGPFWGIAVAVVSDILGFFLLPPGFPFHPGYTLSAATVALLFGGMLHGRSVKLWRTLVAMVTVTLVVSIGMNTIWGFLNMKLGVFVTFFTSLPWRLGLMPVYGTLLFLMQKALRGTVEKLNLFPSASVSPEAPRNSAAAAEISQEK